MLYGTQADKANFFDPGTALKLTVYQKIAIRRVIPNVELEQHTRSSYTSYTSYRDFSNATSRCLMTRTI
jgi:hypothetical protein